MIKSDITIDASGEKLGRLASRAAKILMGKHMAAYTPHIKADVSLTITNASKIHLPFKKRLQKVYTVYSGHPGGLSRENLAHLVGRRGAGEALRRAIQRMLPRNTMQSKRLKRLKITD